jgi:single-stranded DNA-binding protein
MPSDEKLNANFAVIQGRIGEQPTSKETQNGKLIVNLLVGVDSGRMDDSGEPLTDWIPITVFGPQGEIALRRCFVGACVTCQCKIGVWEKQRDDGGVFRNVQIMAFQVAYHDSASEAGGEAEIVDGEDFFGSD